MTDITLCTSTDCRARQDCRRNEACPTALPAGEHQSYAVWHPQAAHACPGFVDGRKWSGRLGDDA